MSGNCDRCGKAFEPTAYSTGYGTKPDGTRICFGCCGREDSDRIANREPINLYVGAIRADGRLCNSGHLCSVTNWPGTLCINARARVTRIFGRKGWNVYFVHRGQHYFGRGTVDAKECMNFRPMAD